MNAPLANYVDLVRPTVTTKLFSTTATSRVAFAPNDERTTKRLLGALGTPRAARADQPVRQTALGLAVARFVSERETPRPLLTLGEIPVYADPGPKSSSTDRNFIVSPLAAANLASVRPADVFGPTIAVALADPTIIVVMVNPDGRLWIELSPLRPPPLLDRQGLS